MNGWLDERAREVRESIAAFRKLGSELSYLQIGWRPPDGGWSIGQVTEHLILSDTAYLALVPRLLARAPRRDRDWKPTVMGKLVTRAVEPQAPRRIKTSKAFSPGPEPRAEVIDEYIKVREGVLGLIDQARGYDLNSIRLTSPFMKLIRYNLGDAFMILTRHTQRHLQQIERVRAHPDFPKS